MEIELLAPAGSKESFKASINAGANAIYLGGKLFSARAFANNFSNEELKEMIKYAHLRNVKVYVTVNTIIFEEEFNEAVKFIEFLYCNKVDGVLIQDLGLASYLHKVYPELVIHASTQLNCHNIAEAKALIELGFKRIVLAREAPISLVKEVKKLGVEVEVFVHGALCVSYSGQCLMSSMIGNRSGNRGRCAQPCRNQMYCKDENKTSSPFAISMRDLCTIDHINELVEYGVDSLKIEGRMKREEYVFEVVSSYRKALDAYFAKQRFDYNYQINEMAKLFNREFTKGYIFNESRTKILNQRTSSHIGLHLGVVSNTNKDYVFIKLDNDLCLNDGIRINNRSQDGQQVQKMFVNGNDVKEAKKGEIVKILKYQINPHVGDEVIKTTSASQIAEIDELMKVEKKIPATITLSAHINLPLEMKMESHNITIKKKSDYIVQESKNPINYEKLQSQINRLGNTSFELENCNLDIDENAFIPNSVINDIRRNLCEELENKLNQKYSENLIPVVNEYSSIIETSKHPFELSCQVENMEQLEVAMKFPYRKILVNNRELYNRYRNEDRVYLSLNRIDEKDDKNAHDKEVISYIKNVTNKDDDLLVSPYMNSVNSYMLDYLYEKGFKEVILSYELSKNRINRMIDAFQNRNGQYPYVAIPLYGYIDLMIMKSCPISNMNKINKDHCNLCKKNHYYLEDRINVDFEMMHDENCTTRILNSAPLYLLDMIEEIEEMNISEGIIYFTKENIKEVENISLDAFARLNGESSSLHLEKITRGHFISEID